MNLKLYIDKDWFSLYLTKNYQVVAAIVVSDSLMEKDGKTRLLYWGDSTKEKKGKVLIVGPVAFHINKRKYWD